MTTEYGTVEYYAKLIRENSRQLSDTYVSVVGVASALVDHAYSTDAEKVRLIKNLLVAGHRVREEMDRGDR